MVCLGEFPTKGDNNWNVDAVKKYHPTWHYVYREIQRSNIGDYHTCRLCVCMYVWEKKREALQSIM